MVQYLIQIYERLNMKYIKLTKKSEKNLSVIIPLDSIITVSDEGDYRQLTYMINNDTHILTVNESVDDIYVMIETMNKL